MVRMPISMWEGVSKGSEKLGISAMEWIRRAIQEKIDKNDTGEDREYVTVDEVRDIIREELRNYEPEEEEK